MHWYNGGIADAITVTKQKRAIFVVYIEGNDEESVRITNIINSDTITKKLECDNFVAIKIEANSVPHQQFSEIYKQAPAPSIFFIGQNGQPLQIITEVKDEQNLSSQVDNILLKAGLTPTGSTPTSEDFIKTEQQAPSNVVCENGVCTIRPPAEVDNSSSSSLSAEEKLNRAKELLEKQRIQKQKEEEEKERQKEIERRKMGQNVQQMKRWQEDQEMRQLKEEREREKRENQAARDRVLAQIAQDKAERASKFSTSPPAPAQPKAATPQPSTSRQQSNVARLQFKLPDGGSNTQEFPSSDSLDQVVTYIKTKLNIPKFKLATTFPRREFTTNDYSQSLMDLQLVPNAVILILPVSSAAVVTSTAATSGLYAFFWSLIGPILGIFQYLRGFLSGGGAGTDSNATDSSAGRSGGTYNKGGSVLHVRSKYDLENKLKMAGSTKLVVIDFFATWCGPCRMIAPKLEELAREFPNVMFLKVDVDENRDIASDYSVSSMPTFAFVKNRRTLTNFSGADHYRLRDTILRYK